MVEALAVREGQLIVAGLFETAGGINAQNIAAWDGSSWSALGSGLSDRTSALALYLGDLYAGGDFQMAGGVSARHIARWDGDSWHEVAGGMSGGPWPMVTALAIHGTQLVAGGWFERAGSVDAGHIALWDGSGWSALGDGVDDFVWCVGSYRGMIIAGGGFANAGGGPAARIAAWDGQLWQPLDAGVQDFARGLFPYGGALYVGGQFQQAGQKPSYYVARWDPAGSDVEEHPGRPGADGTRLRLRAIPAAGDPSGEIGLAFDLPRDMRVTLDILDLAGRRIALLQSGPLAAGSHAVAWRGRAERGQPVASGIYFARLRAGSEQAVRQLWIAR